LLHPKNEYFVFALGLSISKFGGFGKADKEYCLDRNNLGCTLCNKRF